AVAVIEDSTLSGNSAKLNGGGIYDAGAATATTITVRNSTISGNTASGSGGGISVAGAGTADLALVSATLTANVSTSGKGGGVARLNTAGTITISATVVSGNSNAFVPDVSSSTLVNVNDSAIGSKSGFTP